jgi:hypothetical protein
MTRYQVRSLPAQLYSPMPKFVLGSAKNERTQSQPQRPIDGDLHTDLRPIMMGLAGSWRAPDKLAAGGSDCHKMTRAQGPHSQG